jgi:LysM repeat protein
VIQRGDTLLDVAIRFGVSAQSIQDANGITDPRSLQISQELVIPREALTATGTPTATATPLPFAVENITFNRTPLGGLWCFGEIHNITGVELEQAGVTISLLDEGGKALAHMQERVQVELIPPGGRAPFAARFDQPPQNFVSYTVAPWLGVRGYVGSYYRDLEARNVAGTGERYAAYTVSGIIANIGPEDAVGVTVTVTIYDALGRVLGVRRGPPDHNVIPRGGETTFSLQLTPAGGPVARYSVSALGRRLGTPTVPARLPTPTPR